MLGLWLRFLGLGVMVLGFRVSWFGGYGLMFRVSPIYGLVVIGFVLGFWVYDLGF